MSDDFKPKLSLGSVSLNLNAEDIVSQNIANTFVLKTPLNNAEILFCEKKEKEARTDAYEEKKIELLGEINFKLESLDDIVLLLSKSVNYQEETLELLKEIFSIGAAPDKETAHARYQKVIDKINKTAEVIESANTLGGLASRIYNTTLLLL